MNIIVVTLFRILHDVFTYVIQFTLIAYYALEIIALPQSAWEGWPVFLQYTMPVS